MKKIVFFILLIAVATTELRAINETDLRNFLKPALSAEKAERTNALNSGRRISESHTMATSYGDSLPLIYDASLPLTESYIKHNANVESNQTDISNRSFRMDTGRALLDKYSALLSSEARDLIKKNLEEDSNFIIEKTKNAKAHSQEALMREKAKENLKYLKVSTK